MPAAAAVPQDAADLPPPIQDLTPTADWWQSRWWAWLVLALAAAGLGLAVLLWQKLSGIQEELARRSQDTGAQAISARTMAQQAQETARDMAARVAGLESRLSEVSLQRQQLEELMQSLSRSRDENLVVDIEAALRMAQQQSQLTGSVEPMLAALKSAQQRVQRVAQPRLMPVQRAIEKDLDQVKAAQVTDVPGLLIKLDELVAWVDELPLANQAVPASALPTPAATAPANPS